jgi:hypothetical protein
MEKHIFSYSFSFQQPYTYNMSMNPAYQINAMNELARIDFLEEQIQEMNHYPDAEKILKKILDNNS